MRLYPRAEGSIVTGRRSLTRRVQYDPALPAELVQTLARGNLDRLIQQATPLQLKERCSAVQLDHPAGPLMIKRHVWGDWWRTARMLLRAPTARVSATLGLALVEQGVRTPRPRAVVECGFGPCGSSSYLVTDFVPGTSLYRHVRGNGLDSAEL